METIDFSHSWNGTEKYCKIHNRFFTTFRPHNQTKYQKGKTYLITFKNAPVKQATIIKLKPCTVNSLSVLFFYLDTGYNKETSLKIIKTMYKLSDKDINIKLFDVILFRSIV